MLLPSSQHPGDPLLVQTVEGDGPPPLPLAAGYKSVALDKAQGRRRNRGGRRGNVEELGVPDRRVASTCQGHIGDVRELGGSCTNEEGGCQELEHDWLAAGGGLEELGLGGGLEELGPGGGLEELGPGRGLEL